MLRDVFDAVVIHADKEGVWPNVPSLFHRVDVTGEVDAIVMGRVTFEQVCGFGAWPYEGTPLIVLSSLLLAPTPPVILLPIEARRATTSSLDVTQAASSGE